MSWLRKICATATVAATLSLLTTALSSPSPALAAPADTTGPYYIYSYGTGQCIDDPRNSLTKNTIMDVYTCETGATNEEWDIETTTAGGSWIVNVKSGMCLTVQNASKASGAYILQYPCNTGANALWAVPAYISGNIFWGYEIKNKNSGLCVNFVGDSNNAKLQQFGCDQSSDLWEL